MMKISITLMNCFVFSIFLGPLDCNAWFVMSKDLNVLEGDRNREQVLIQNCPDCDGPFGGGGDDDPPIDDSDPPIIKIQGGGGIGAADSHIPVPPESGPFGGGGGCDDCTIALERASQHVGFGTGVEDSQGVGDRSRVMDQGDMLRYLSAPETIQGEVVAVNHASGLMYLDMSGNSYDERQSITESLNMQALYFDEKTKMENINEIGKGDYVSVQILQEVTDATKNFSTRRKILKSVEILDGNQLLGGARHEEFGGGLGQRPNPY